MNFNKPKFWDKKSNIYSILLFPITFLILIFIFFKKKLTKVNLFKIPVLCIGNIYIGGTGKTPLCIDITKELQKLRKNPVIIKKYYKNQEDERLLIKYENLPLITKRNRYEAIKEAESKFDMAILDDGFQDTSIKKNLNIICFHENQLIGNGYVFPSGPLRENINTIKNVSIAIINGKKNEKFEKQILKINSSIKFFYTNYVFEELQKFKNKNLLAIAGIGNPNNFFELLKKNGMKVKKTLPYPDHYEFNREELLKIINLAQTNNYTIVTTQKDFLRIKKFNLKEFNNCIIKLEIQNKEKLISLIKNLYD